MTTEDNDALIHLAVSKIWNNIYWRDGIGSALCNLETAKEIKEMMFSEIKNIYWELER